MLTVCPWCYEKGNLNQLIYEDSDTCSCVVHGKMTLKEVLSYKAECHPIQTEECRTKTERVVTKSS